ncbi:hypothetical protein [Brucella intermedia]|uniref:hypothetical protein n=1 Tax=Brucella intermedia TaxID=94625 RepID=UPI002449AE5F|nr:hypothetical protein [Brucella intermedia]WGG58253.1 hypothetical protein QA414_07735 [Brucella intermedia]
MRSGKGRVKNGLRAGWTEYRYGEKPKKIEPIYRGDARQSMVNRVMDTLTDWRLSRFEREGPVVAGLRSALCLEGYPFAQAEREAESLVSTAFTKLGYARPSYEEGQREYVTPRENCAWCDMLIPEEFFREDRPINYCSDICAKAALQWRDFKGRYRDSIAYRAAYDTIRRSQYSTRNCETCGTSFRPHNEDGKYCSIKCRHIGLTKYSHRPCQLCGKDFRPSRPNHIYCSMKCVSESQKITVKRLCLHCGMDFETTPSEDQKYCSVKCKHAGGYTTRYEIVCEWCGKSATVKLPYARCCGHTCATTLSGIRSGKKYPKRLAPPVFDYFFKQAA